jgi:hypothetical protein
MYGFVGAGIACRSCLPFDNLEIPESTQVDPFSLLQSIADGCQKAVNDSLRLYFCEPRALRDHINQIRFRHKNILFIKTT